MPDYEAMYGISVGLSTALAVCDRNLGPGATKREIQAQIRRIDAWLASKPEETVTGHCDPHPLGRGLLGKSLKGPNAGQ